MMDRDFHNGHRPKQEATAKLLLVPSLVKNNGESSHEKDSIPPLPYDHHDFLLNQTAAMLSKQWKRGGSVKDYLQKITTDNNGLPASYILIEQKEESTSSLQLLGHGRLTECFESLSGNTVAATYIVISEAARGRGYGSRLMTMLEEEAIRLGYHYMYLWTHTATDFYKKLGYQETEKVSVYRACLKSLECEQVNQLEEMLRSMQQKFSNDSSSKPTTNVVTMKETVLLPPDDDDNAPTEDDVWLRKRLIEYVPSNLIQLEDRLNEIKSGLAAYEERMARNTRMKNWKYHFVLQVPWQKQVGPSCGLASLRMIRDYYLSMISTANETNAKESKEKHMPSLLNEAKDRGYTCDGEIFNAENLAQLANEVCGFPCKLRSFRDTSPLDMLRILGPVTYDVPETNDGKGNGLVIIPYDNHKTSKLPCKNSGLTAHYGIVVGIVFGFDDTTTEPNLSDATSVVEALKFMDQDEIPISVANEANDIVLLVQHSLSPQLSIASWYEFFDSNQQLVSFDSVKYSASDLNLKDCLIECQGF